MIEKLLKNMEEAKNERVARELLTKELQIGRLIQKELFPTHLPTFPHLEIGTGFLPAQEVAGDFYDLYPKQDRLFLAIADGSGKGVSPCLYSLIVRSIMRSRFVTGEEVDEILNQTNQLFCDDTGMTGNFVTSFAGIYDANKKTLTFANAGHFPAILIHPSGAIEELTTPGIALGVERSAQIEKKEVVLQEGSFLFLYTDGVIEAENKSGEFFGKTRLIDFLTTVREKPAQAIIDSLIIEVQNFAQGAFQDDLTALGLKPY